MIQQIFSFRISDYSFVTIFLGLIISGGFMSAPLYANAADLRANLALPTNGTTFYDTESITFIGSAENASGDNISDGGYADLEIDWNSDGGPGGPGGANGHDENHNAYITVPPPPDLTLGNFSAWFVKPLEKEISAPLPLGTHRYRFNVDTSDILAESNESNNRSAWVSFTVNATPFAPIITFTASDNQIDVGESTNLTWSATYATACTKSSSPAGWSAGNETSNTNVPVSPTQTTTYTLVCTGPGGSASKSVTIDINMLPPSVTLVPSVNPVTAGNSTNMVWTVSGADSCTASDGWSGSKSVAGGSESVSPATTTTYTLSCQNVGGTTVVQRIINVNQLTPVISFTASPATIVANGTTQLIWSVTGATSCYAPITGASGFGVTTSKNPISGSATVAPPTTQVYRLDCGNANGTSSAVVTVNVTGLPNLHLVPFPGFNLIHTASTMIEGATTTYLGRVKNGGTAATPIGFTNQFAYNWGWTSHQDLGYRIQPVLGAGETASTYDESNEMLLDRSGLLEMKYCVDQTSTLPTSRITETIENDNCGYRVYGIPPAPGAPTLTMGLSNSYFNNGYYLMNRVGIGSTSTITWSTTGATSCIGRINSPYGTDSAWRLVTATSGSFVAKPADPMTNYTLDCTGPGGRVVKAVRINLNIAPPQILSFTASQNSVLRGSTAELSWTATSSYRCTASGGWSGAKSQIAGQETVGPINSQTTYVLTCDTPSLNGAIGGSISQQVTIGVYDPPPQITFTTSRSQMTPLDTATLTWSTTDATSCTASGGWSGAKTTGSNQTEILAPDVTTTYTLSCTGSGGTVVKDVTITVGETAPIITPFTLSENIIVHDDSADITWSVAGATSCTATQGTSDWTSLSSATLLSTNSFTVSPTTDTTYQLQCTGPWGTASSVPLTVYVIPRADIKVFQLCDAGGGSCTSYAPEDVVHVALNPSVDMQMEWEVEDADNCYATGSGGGQGFSTGGVLTGTDGIRVPALPGESYTYTIVCSYAGNPTNQASIIIDVNRVQPNIWLGENVVRIQDGEEEATVEVFWDANNGDHSVCSISGGGLTNALLVPGTDEGSAEVEVTGRTEFSLTCGSETDTEIVEIGPEIWES